MALNERKPVLQQNSTSNNNVIEPSSLSCSSSTIIDNNTESTTAIPLTSNNNSSNSTSLLSLSTISNNALISIFLLPLTLLVNFMKYFQDYIYTNFQIDTQTKNDFLTTIPQQQESLQHDMDYVKGEQKELGRNIDNLMKRVQALEERRKRREEAISHWVEDDRHEHSEEHQ